MEADPGTATERLASHRLHERMSAVCFSLFLSRFRLFRELGIQKRLCRFVFTCTQKLMDRFLFFGCANRHISSSCDRHIKLFGIFRHTFDADSTLFYWFFLLEIFVRMLFGVSVRHRGPKSLGCWRREGFLHQRLTRG